MKNIRVCFALLWLFASAQNSKIQAASITWTNTEGGLWSAATNWSPNQVPSTNDTALITSPGSYTVATDKTNYVMNLTIGALSGSTTQTLLFTNELNIGSNTVVQGGGLFLITNAVSFYGRGSVSVTAGGTLTEYAGVLNYFFEAPSVIISNGGVVNACSFPTTFDSFLGISFPAATFDASVIIANGGTLNAASNTYSLFTVQSGGTLNATSENISAVWTNAGTINLTNVTFQSSTFETEPSAPGLINLPGGVVNLTGTNYLSEGVLTNFGAIVQHSGFTTLYAPNLVPGPGTISNLDGLMDIEYFGTNLSGNYYAAAGATNDFLGNDEYRTYTNNTIELDPHLALDGPGQYAISSGYLVLDSTPPPNLLLMPDTITLSPNFQGGSITNLTILNTANLAGAPTYLSSDLPITGALTISNANYAVLSAHVKPGGILNLYKPAQFGQYLDDFRYLLVDAGAVVNCYGPMLDYGSWTNFGTINFYDGHLDVATNLLNEPDATISLNGLGGITFDFTNTTFTNLGVLINNSPGATNNISDLNYPSASQGFDNSHGVISNLAGGLYLASIASDTLSGSYYTAAGAVTQFAGPTNANLTLANSLALSGPGQVQFVYGNLYLSSSLPGNLDLAGGTLELAPDFEGGVITNLSLNGIIFSNTSSEPLIIAGPFNVTNSGLSGYYYNSSGIYADLIITNHGIITATNSVFYGKLTQTNGGAANLFQTTLFSNIVVGPGCVLSAGGVYSSSGLLVGPDAIVNCLNEIQPQIGFFLPALSVLTLTNAGTINLTNSSLVLNENGPDSTNSGGMMNLPTGVVQLWGPTAVESDNGYLINQGQIVSSSATLSGLIAAFGTNTGAITSKNGPFVLDGGWTLLPSSSLSVALNGPTNDGSFIFSTNLQIPTASGVASLAGSFRASVGSGYAPVSGTSFDVVSYASLGGSFSAITPPAEGKWTTTYGPSDLILTLGGGLPAFSAVSETVNGSSLSFSGGGGTSGSKFQILETTNIALPSTEWTPVLTNTFDASGNFQVEITPPKSASREFYLLRLP